MQYQINKNRMNDNKTGAAMNKQTILSSAIGLSFAFLSFNADAANIVGVQTLQASNEESSIIINFDGQPNTPKSFVLQNPARLALDFPSTGYSIATNKLKLSSNLATSIAAAQAQNRTRMVVNLTNDHTYQVRKSGNQIMIDLQRHHTSNRQAVMLMPQSEPSVNPMPQHGLQQTSFQQNLPSQNIEILPQIHSDPFSSESASSVLELDSSGADFSLKQVDFRRADDDGGKIVLTLSDPLMPLEIREEGTRIILEMTNTSVADELIRRMDVTDFATMVKFVDTTHNDGITRVSITPNTSKFEHVAYQTDDIFTLEIKPKTQKVQAKQTLKKKSYRGDKLSLNFQDIEVRSVLQLLADFTDLNVVVADSVKGNLTLRLKNVPWDQALDIILQAKSLDKRRNGDIIYVAPAEEIQARETAELESLNKKVKLAPLRTEFIAINYAKAADLAKLLQTSSGQSDEKQRNSVLSSRGSATLDERTNTLLVTDTSDKLDEVRELISQLDIPVRQVLIESRVVIANDNFNKELGVRLGTKAVERNSDNRTWVASGTLEGTQEITVAAANQEAIPIDNASYNVNLPTSVKHGSIALSLLKLPFGSLLDLELSAMQAEGKGEVISSPRIVTANQKEAYIEQGVEVPYQEESGSGGTTTSFRKAVLGLKVTPQITPDDRVVMDLTINKDSVGQTVGGIPSIDTRELSTQVLVQNGETVVLGGVYEQIIRDEVTKVPFFGDLPFVGRLFRGSLKEDDKTELLVFVTPKIVRDKIFGK